MRIVSLLLVLLMPTLAFGIEKAEKVVVVKSESKLYLLKNKRILGVYRVAFGAHPKGPKQREGDQRTPEGSYLLDYKKDDSAFYKAIHISYPNEKDKQRARKSGVDPGGLIMIHGQKNGCEWLSRFIQHINWTDGCIAVSNRAMDEIWEAVNVGTPIEIIP
jgi:murein L,D-transpeptidase YafK